MSSVGIRPLSRIFFWRGCFMAPVDCYRMYALRLVVAAACLQASLAAWCHRPDVDCSGHNLPSPSYYETGTLDYCKEKCIEKGCKSFLRKNNECWLKDHVCENVELRPNVGGHDYFLKSGPECDLDVVEPWHLTQYCHRPGKKCEGHNIVDVSGLYDVATCQRLCDFQPTCRSILYSNDGQCWLKFHACTDSTLTSVSGLHDYVKTDKYGQACGNPAGAAGLGYCYRFGFSCRGNTIRTIPGPIPPNACYDACNADPKCKSITIYYDTSKGCKLKNHVCENHEVHPSHYSYDVVKHSGACDDYDRPQNKYCLRSGKDCTNPGWGHDIVYAIVSSASHCQYYCDYQRDCKSIRVSGSSCWLKRHHCADAQLNSSPSGDYYYKC